VLGLGTWIGRDLVSKEIKVCDWGLEYFLGPRVQGDNLKSDMGFRTLTDRQTHRQPLSRAQPARAGPPEQKKRKRLCYKLASQPLSLPHPPRRAQLAWTSSSVTNRRRARSAWTSSSVTDGRSEFIYKIREESGELFPSLGLMCLVG